MLLHGSQKKLISSLIVAALLLLVSLILFFFIMRPPAAINLLLNGDLEQIADKPAEIAGWSHWRWEGEAVVVQTSEVAYQGQRSAMLNNSGPAKAAIFQKLRLRACGYRLTGAVGASVLAPGVFNLTSTLHIAIEGQGETSHALVAGTTDWRRFELIFNVKTDSSAIIYFFNYGSGRLFVDDVRLVAIDGCRQLTDSFKLETKSSAPLRFEPKITFNDTLLLGYCGDAGFARRAVCTRLQGNVPARVRADAAMLLDDFEGGKPSIFTGGWQPSPNPIAGQRSALLRMGQYMRADASSGLPSDWRAYDQLRLEVRNASSTPQKLYIEIRDASSRDYWSRVNWYSIVPPGSSTVHVPLQVFVGEKIAVRAGRRLDLEHITHLFLSASEAKIDLVIDDVRLEPEKPFENDFPRLIKLDVGPASAPVMSGFHALHPSMDYAEWRGFGISAGTKIARIEDRRHPDNLFRDWISFHKGGLDFDLPNGRYHVWMMIEDPGYWDYYPNFTQRQVFAQGNTVIDERPTAADFLQKYLQHSDDEDWPGDNIWQRYVRARYVPHRFEVEVANGKLEIRFESGGNPYALALSALIIYPAAEEKRGSAFLDELWRRLNRQFDQEYQQLAPPRPTYAKPSANALDGKLWVFHRDTSLPIQADDWPSAAELVDRLDVELARGERRTLAIGLTAADELQLLAARVSVPGVQATASSVRFKTTRATSDGTVYWNVPRLLDPLPAANGKPVVVPAGRSRSIWLELEQTHDAKEGLAEGLLTLEFSGGITHSLPIAIKLNAWTLPAADIPIGYLGVGTHYTGAVFRELDGRRNAELGQTVDILRQHGMTAITGGIGGPRFSGYEAGRPTIDFSHADRVMAAVKDHFRGPLDTYGGMGIEGLETYRVEDTARHGKPYVDVLRDILTAIGDHGARNGWLTLEHVVGDEPGGDSLADTLHVARAFKQALPEARTSVFTSMLDPGKDERSKLAGLVSHLYLTSHSKAAIEYVRQQGSECSLYNLQGRYRRGIYLYKMRSIGCGGHLQFAFNVVGSDPWYDLDSREADSLAVFPHQDGSLRRALDLVRYRQAIDDYRHLLKLEQSIASASDGEAKTAAQAWLTSLLDSIEVGSNSAPAFADEGLEQVRRTAAQYISRLEGQQRK